MNQQELFNIVYKYAVDIVEKKIIACKKHIQACKRFIDDIEKYKEADYPYYFDANELLDFYEWARLFKHRTGIVMGQRIELVPWQLFIAGNLFSWKRKSNNFRRFRKAFITVGRKNAKSELLSLIATYENFVVDDNSEVYITGWNRDGSDIVYREIKWQLEHPYEKDFFKGKYSTSYNQITHLKSGSFIKPLSRDAKNTDNANNPSLAIVDEYKDHVTSEIYDNLETGMTRPNSLIVIISTAGTNLNCPMMYEYKYVSKILDPNLPGVVNDEYFIMICELDEKDDWKDEKVWPKANPIVCSTENGYEILRGKVKTAIDAPEKQRSTKTKNFNIWVDSKENGYMEMSKWNDNEENFNLEDFRGVACVLGMDLSTKLDLTSISLEFLIDDVYYIYQHSFLPEEQYQKRVREAKYRFDLWHEQGFLTVIPGATIDYNYVLNYIQMLEKEYDITILEIVYDPAHAYQFIVDLSEFYGYTCVELRQGPFSLNEPTEDFRKQVYDNKVKHTNDGLLNWAMSNAVAANVNRKQAYTMLDKAKSYEKIDPAAATINAHARGMKILGLDGGTFCYSPPI